MLAASFDTDMNSPRVLLQTRGKRKWKITLWVRVGSEINQKIIKNKTPNTLTELIEVAHTEIINLQEEYPAHDKAGFTVTLLR